jgi:CTP:molybdopterin cytidylyltransferase MocA
LFTPPLLPELLALRGDRGARSVVERDASRVRYVDFARPAPRDVDTVTDLANLANELRTS